MKGPLSERVISLVEMQSSGYDAFAPFAEALGLAFGMAKSVSLRVDRTPVQLSLSINSGVVCGVEMTADLEVPAGMMEETFISLSRETAQHLGDKAALLAVEVQVGEPGFDDAVYIDSNAAEADVQRVLARQATRVAARRLIHLGVHDVRLTSRRVSVSLPAGGLTDPWAAERMSKALEAVVAIAAGGGPRGAVQPRRGQSLLTLAGLLFLFSCAALVAACTSWPAGVLFPLVGFVVTAPAALVLSMRFARSAVAGDSASGRRLRTLSFFLCLAGGVFGATGLLAVNALGRDLVTQVGTVTDASEQDDETGHWLVRVRLENGARHSVWKRSPPAVGTQVTRTFHRGLLVEWDERFDW